MSQTKYRRLQKSKDLLPQNFWAGYVTATQTCRIRRFYLIKWEVLADKDVVRNIFVS